jgi:hypothetical protein
LAREDAIVAGALLGGCSGRRGTPPLIRSADRGVGCARSFARKLSGRRHGRHSARSGGHGFGTSQAVELWRAKTRSSRARCSADAAGGAARRR